MQAQPATVGEGKGEVVNLLTDDLPMGASRGKIEGTGFIIRAKTGVKEEFSFVHYLGDTPKKEES